MAKLLTNREAELLRVALYYAKLYFQSNPLLGLPSPEELGEVVTKHLSFEIDEDDIDEALENIEGS